MYDNYGKENQQLISKVRLNEIDKLNIKDLEEGDMGPKVRASIAFIENGGEEAVIGNLKRLSESLHGTAGLILYHNDYCIAKWETVINRI